MCISGFGEDDIKHIKGNLVCFNEVISLLSGIKACLIKHMGLTISSAERMTNDDNSEICEQDPPPKQNDNKEIVTESEYLEYEKEI